MKVLSSVRKGKAGDIIVRRRGVIFRLNPDNPRRKARQPYKKKGPKRLKSQKFKKLRKGLRRFKLVRKF